MANNSQYVPTGPPRFSKNCGHCGQGIPYDVMYAWCKRCDIPFCDHCRDEHPLAHGCDVYSLTSRETFSNSVPDVHLCLNCFQSRHTRIGCNECEFALCYMCWSYHRASVAHDHKGFTVIEPPMHSALAYITPSCTHCTNGTSLMHCHRCASGIELQQSVYICKTCAIIFESVIEFCTQCYYEERGWHDPTHQFCQILLKYVYPRSEREDWASKGLQCLECSQVLNVANPTQIRDSSSLNPLKHEHSEMALLIGATKREAMHRKTYRMCARKLLHIERVPQTEDTGIKCNRCRKAVRWSVKSVLCTLCMETFCDTCDQAQAVKHRHPGSITKLNVEQLWPSLGGFDPGWICGVTGHEPKVPLKHTIPRIKCNVCQYPPFYACLSCVKAKRGFHEHIHIGHPRDFTLIMKKPVPAEGTTFSQTTTP